MNRGFYYAYQSNAQNYGKISMKFTDDFIAAIRDARFSDALQLLEQHPNEIYIALIPHLN